ncbi:odorant receptor 128 [Nasonia vitripennis]|uniref:Odorant receptor n=1 Tax=Nasonia vitripennis TaxID=7425 RepID=A0A7M6UDZ4_NASVI|nr:odorant receptor 128 [Nasonia vitripennis]
MDVLHLNFRVLQYCGIWYEYPENLWLVKMVYKTLIVVMLFCFTLSELTELVLNRNNVHDLTECLFLSLTFLTCCFKMINFLCRQEGLNRILNAYRADVFQPKTTEEKQMTTQYQNLISKFFMVYLIMALLSGICLSLIPIISSASNETQFPAKSYQPYNTQDSTLYLITYFHQILSIFFGIFINVSMDMLVCGFIILACCQLDLCCYRISLNKKDTSTNDHVVHHVLIGHAVNRVQSFFIVIIVLLFIFNLIVLCTSLFQIPQKNIMTLEFFTLFVYLVGILFQVYVYCWFGNQLQLKSKTISDAIYESNWPDLTPCKRKDYIFSMFMSQNGFTISFHGQCSLSIKTYVWIVKTSYAVYNLLQNTST